MQTSNLRRCGERVEFFRPSGRSDQTVEGEVFRKCAMQPSRQSLSLRNRRRCVGADALGRINLGQASHSGLVGTRSHPMVVAEGSRSEPEKFVDALWARLVYGASTLKRSRTSSKGALTKLWQLQNTCPKKTAERNSGN